jgi:Type IV secretion system pilin
MKIVGKVFLASLACFPPAVVLAQGLQNAGMKLEGLSKHGVTLSSNLGSVTNTVIASAFYILGTVFLGLTIYGGFVWIKSAGREEEVTRARKIVTTAVIGLVILLSSYAITNFILQRASGVPVGGGAMQDSAGDTSGLGCCLSSTEETKLPLSQSDCLEKGGAFVWQSSSCQ